MKSIASPEFSASTDKNLTPPHPKAFLQTQAEDLFGKMPRAFILTYNLVERLSNNRRSCAFASNEFLCELMHEKLRTVQRELAYLEEHKWIYRIQWNTPGGKRRELIPRSRALTYLKNELKKGKKPLEELLKLAQHFELGLSVFQAKKKSTT